MEVALDSAVWISPAVTQRSIGCVVVCHNPDQAVLERCIDSIFESTDVAIEIVVIDNGSAMAVSILSRGDVVRVVRSESNGGFAHGVNLGLAEFATRHEFVAILNDDTRVARDALAHCVAALIEHGDRCVAVAPKILAAVGDRTSIDSVGNLLLFTGEGMNRGIGEPDIGQFDSPERIFGACFAAAVFRVDAFRGLVGPLDERYFLYYEDLDWNLRALRLGYETWSVPAAVVFHHHALSTRRLGLARRYALVERNLLICATLNLEPRTVARIWLRRFYVHTVGAVRGPYRLARWQSIGQATVRLPQILRERARRRRQRDGCPSVTDREIMAFGQGEAGFFDDRTFTSQNSDVALRHAEARLQARQRR